MRISEWHTLVAALQSAFVAGFIYTFPTYANALQIKHGFDEGAKQIIGIAGPMCNFFTWTIGFIMDATSVPFCTVLGGVIVFVSYGLFGAIALGHIVVGHPVAAFFVLGFAGNYGASFLISATFTVLTKNFGPDKRPAVLSMGKMWVGVSSGVITTIFLGLFPTHDQNSPDRLYFLYVLAIVGGVIAICAAPFMRPLDPNRPEVDHRFAIPTSERLPIIFAVSGVAIALTGGSLFVLNAAALHPIFVIVYSVVLIVVALAPFIVVMPVCSPAPTPEAVSLELVSGEGLHTDATKVAANGGEAEAFVPPPVARRSPWETGPGGMMRRAEFYMLWFCTFNLQSGGLFLVANLASMCLSRGGVGSVKVDSAMAITVFACTQGVARLLTGSLSTKLVENNLPRTFGFPILMAIMAVGHLVFCLPGHLALYFGTGLCAIAFGAAFPLLIMSVGEVFGQARISSNYMIFNGTPGACGTLIFAKFVAIEFYNFHADENMQCHGDICYRDSHIAIAATQCVGVVIGILFALRTGVVYRALAGRS